MFRCTFVYPAYSLPDKIQEQRFFSEIRDKREKYTSNTDSFYAVCGNMQHQ